MPSRRPHQKSRNGCALCKKRRVKCDGALPSCRNCVKYESTCSFSKSQSNGSSPHESHSPPKVTTTPPRAGYEKAIFESVDASDTSSISTSTSNGQRQELILDSPESVHSIPRSFNSSPEGLTIDLNRQAGPLTGLYTTSYDEELLNHYLTATYLSFSSVQPVQEVYQTVIPEEALSHGHLMHAMLAFSAAHLMHTKLNHRDFYERKARRHQHLALSSSIAEFHDINPSNCHALFGTAGIIAILAFALQSPLANMFSSPVDDIADFFTLVRGIKTVLRSTCFDWIVEGKLKALLNYDWHPPVDPLKDDLKDVFDHLIELNKTAVKNPDLQETYRAATQSLQRAFETYSVIDHEKTLAFIWAVNLPELYISLVKRRESMALVILANYGVLLHSINGIWWSEGRGARLVEAIYQTLPSTWQPELQWPRDVIQGKRSLTLAA